MNVGSHAKRAALVAAVVLAFAMPATAQQPSAAALTAAKELIEIKGAEKFFQPITRGVIEQTKNLFLQTNPTLAKDLNEVSASLMVELAPRHSEVVDEIVRYYAMQFTEQELKDLTAFYKSPLGKKALEIEPRIMDQTMNFAQEWSRRFSEVVISRMRAEMKKRGHDI
jgi:hypothetical protein